MAKQKALRRAGVDVSARWMDVSRDAADEAVAVRQCANTAAGQRGLGRGGTRGGRGGRGGRARVVLEATGFYSLGGAPRWRRGGGMGVMVINPRARRESGGAGGRRARSDAGGAAVLREYAARMPFTPWTPPPPAALA